MLPCRRVAAIAGFGVAGISSAVARRLGARGFGLALLARREERLREGAAALLAAGAPAACGYECDLGDPEAVRRALRRVAQEMGPVEVLHYNPYNSVRTPLLEMRPEDVDALMGVSVKGLLAAVQELLPGWEAMAAAAAAAAAAAEGAESGGAADAADGQPPFPPRPALLVTGGGLALAGAARARRAAAWGVEGIAVAKAAQHKLVAVLRETLAPRGVFVGQATVLGTVRGTAWDEARASMAEEEQEQEAGKDAATAAAAAAAASGGAISSGAQGGSGAQGDSGAQGAGSAAKGGATDAPEEDSVTDVYVTPDEVAAALVGLLDQAPPLLPLTQGAAGAVDGGGADSDGDGRWHAFVPPRPAGACPHC